MHVIVNYRSSQNIVDIILSNFLPTMTHQFIFMLCFCRIELGEEPLVKTAASVFQDLCYGYRDQLSAGIICAGWDRRKGGQVGLAPLSGS